MMKKTWYYLGSQVVNFTVDSIQAYADIQAKLIENGFNQFETQFVSTELDAYKSQAIEKAIESAKAKASIMARATDRKIRRISKVSDTEDTEPSLVYHQQMYALGHSVGAPDNQALTEIAQTIPVTATVKVVFELK